MGAPVGQEVDLVPVTPGSEAASPWLSLPCLTLSSGVSGLPELVPVRVRPCAAYLVSLEWRRLMLYGVLGGVSFGSFGRCCT